ncbi:MAG: hypothetical protein V4692_16010 [Bdellovibrionota bacterium]
MSFTSFARNKTVIKVLSLAIVTLTVVTTFTEDAEARRRRRRRSKVKRAVINEPKLFERLGGQKAITEMVDNWVRLSLADDRLAGSLGDTSRTDVTIRLRKNLVEQLCEIADGPCTSKFNAKTPLDVYMIPETQFTVFANHLAIELDARLIGEREKNELIGRLGAARADQLPEEADSESTTSR